MEDTIGQLSKNAATLSKNLIKGKRNEWEKNLFLKGIPTC